jgi:uncharacterized protein (TIGR00299 family) protein
VSRAAYFDCFSGISGDMVLGALLACGAEASVLDGVVAALGLDEEVAIEVRREERGHLSGTRVLVTAGDGSVRALPELLRLVREAPGLPDRVRSRSLAALELLGQAESLVHGVPAAEIHLHELGGADTLVDIVGSFSLLESLGIDEVYCSPLPAERGWAGEPGGLPLPAPAALQVLALAGAVLEPVEERVELVTPTGAAIVAASARFERPALRPTRIGYGIGGRSRPGNALRVWLGTPVMASPAADRIAVLETNLDDMAPNLLAALVEDLLAAGALDVSVAPALMKKGRPGQLVSVLAPPELADELARLLLRSSPTLGVRITEARRLLAERQVLEVETELGRGRVKVKYLDGEAVEWAPEYEDARKLARASGRELREVMRLLSEAARER